MRVLDGDQFLVRIFLGESDTQHHTPLARALLERLRAEGFADATVVHGVAGFGANSVIHTARVDQRNFDGYTPPYMKDAPIATELHIVPSAEPPTACGECPVPVISPAVVNALFRLTGTRYRTLPLTRL